MQKSQTKRGGLPCETFGIFIDWIVQNAVFRCSRYVALPAIIPHGRGEGERFIYSCYGDVGHSVSQPVKLYDDGKGTCWYCRTGNIVTIVCQDVQVTEKKEVQLCVLPEELRPSVRFVGFGTIPGYSSIGHIAANVSGNVRIYSASGTGAFTANLTYPIV